jgi:hypothetical protein
VALQCLGRHAEALAAFSSGLAQAGVTKCRTPFIYNKDDNQCLVLQKSLLELQLQGRADSKCGRMPSHWLSMRELSQWRGLVQNPTVSLDGGK